MTPIGSPTIAHTGPRHISDAGMIHKDRYERNGKPPTILPQTFSNESRAIKTIWYETIVRKVD